MYNSWEIIITLALKTVTVNELTPKHLPKYLFSYVG